jgi:Fur family ferric uptake transcriptional regulator
VLVEQPGPAVAYVRRLEAAVAPEHAEIVGAQDRSFGRHNADAEESYHTITGHGGSVYVGPPSIDLVSTSAELADVLRARGLRLTAQRQLVLEAVYALGHATPDQVHAEVAKTAAGINITTVYRTLELLEELGLVTHAHLSHGAPTYHTLGDEQHAHLVCRACGGVEEISPGLLEPFARQLAGERGFVIDVAHVALFGLCVRCGAQA